MEARLDAVSEALTEAEAALLKLEGCSGEYEKLLRYYGSRQWMRDFEADEAGRLPEDLKRGVLSEDAVWDLTERYRGLKELMLRLCGDEVGSGGERA